MFRHDCEGSSFWSPNTSRTARSRSSCGYLPGRVMAPTPHESENPGTPGQFTRVRARDLPETRLRVASPSPTAQALKAPLTCSVAWVGEVLHSVVNHRRIDGKWLMAFGHP
jgi:hypothetical protein